ncbi:MAG: peptidase MA family metallohydrolase [Chloroflexota bacterium]
MRSRAHANGIIAILLIVLIVALVWNWPSSRKNIVSARSALYALARERGRADYAESIAAWHEQASEHFVIRYQSSDADIAGAVLAAAEEHQAEVARDIGYAPQVKTLIALYPTRESLRDSFGWPANQNAVGVYWAGAIRLLSPHAWVMSDDPDEIARVFRASGPVVHEYTHLVLDYRTGGNYTRWFTEGLAQWEEQRITGYVWDEPDGDLADYSPDQLYTLRDLGGSFDSLDNQALAYRESLSFVTYLASADGGAKLKAVIARLAEHYPLDLALADVYRLSVDRLEQDWLAWVQANPRPWK